MTVNNPAGGLFAPSGGVFFNGSGGGHSNTLTVQGGAVVTEIFDYAPNAADGGHDGDFSLINGATTAHYVYTELKPVLVNAGTPQNVLFNLVNNGLDNQVVLAPTTPGMAEILSQIDTFEKTTFVVPSGSVTITADGLTGQTFNVQALPGAVVVVNGVGASTLNFEASKNPVGTPAFGLTLNGSPTVMYTGISAINLNDAAGVDAAVGPDTADRATAFTGLSANERFVQALYLDDLGRAGARSELDGWAALFGAPA